MLKGSFSRAAVAPGFTRGAEQTTAAGLRQADGLLSVVHADAAESARLRFRKTTRNLCGCSVTAASGASDSIMPSSRNRKASPRHFRSERISSVRTELRSYWATTSFSDMVCRRCSSSPPAERREPRSSPIRCATPSATAAYLAAGALHVEKMGRGFAWLDTIRLADRRGKFCADLGATPGHEDRVPGGNRLPNGVH